MFTFEAETEAEAQAESIFVFFYMSNVKQEKKPNGRDFLFSSNSSIGTVVGKQTINVRSLT
jgi:hypothetical protein